MGGYGSDMALLLRDPVVAFAPHVALMAMAERNFAAGTLAPGTLWLGPDGIGKHRWAHKLARRILCIGDGSDACACASCAQAADHPDFIALSEDALKIEAVRGVIERCVMRPLVSRHRVVLVRDAHALTLGAQNAFLKTLEEPVGQTFFFLLTHRERGLLQTIRSRAQKLRFAPFDAAGFATHFPELAPFAAASGGSIAEALRLKDSEVPALAPLLRATLAERIKAAEQLAVSHESTELAARRYADQLCQWARAGTREQRVRAERLFCALGELVRLSEGNVSRRLLWERWLMAS